MTIYDFIEKYEAAGLDGFIRCMMPAGPITIEFEDGSTYAEGDDERLEDMLDRVERSKKAGRNLFKEEWELYEYEYEPGVVL